MSMSSIAVKQQQQTQYLFLWIFILFLVSKTTVKYKLKSKESIRRVWEERNDNLKFDMICEWLVVSFGASVRVCFVVIAIACGIHLELHSSVDFSNAKIPLKHNANAIRNEYFLFFQHVSKNCSCHLFSVAPFITFNLLSYLFFQLVFFTFE